MEEGVDSPVAGRTSVVPADVITTEQEAKESLRGLLGEKNPDYEASVAIFFIFLLDVYVIFAAALGRPVSMASAGALFGVLLVLFVAIRRARKKWGAALKEFSRYCGAVTQESQALYARLNEAEEALAVLRVANDIVYQAMKSRAIEVRDAYEAKATFLVGGGPRPDRNEFSVDQPLPKVVRKMEESESFIRAHIEKRIAEATRKFDHLRGLAKRANYPVQDDWQAYADLPVPPPDGRNEAPGQ